MTSQIQMIKIIQRLQPQEPAWPERQCIDQKHTILRRFTEPSAPLCWVWTFSKFIIEYLSTRSTLNSFRKCPENPCWLIFWRPSRRTLPPHWTQIAFERGPRWYKRCIEDLIQNMIICQCSGPKVSEVRTSGDTFIGGNEQCSGRTRGCAQLSCRMRSWY